ncbi:VCBS repeat-containing protein [Georgenia sp. EYE_87]|uniref:FG-GAP repeat domain-containing protein n=1 Tax=Georgenia sp. EYE_87 TaxID=2853448 RepID=UPI002006D5B9|nr:VCBS repeat-containing protein [Georgenia sp. EYE_87]MCK6210806.1 VCBS repeat-containing protein [Georgenia sp. EYE_87]
MEHHAARRPLPTILGVVVATTAILLGLAGPVAAFRGGSVDDPAARNPVTRGPTGRTYLLNNGWDAAHDRTVVVGNHYDRVYTGDFDGDGRDTVVVRRGATYLLGRCNQAYGRVNDETFVGDFDGDGTDTLAVRRGRTIAISNTPCATRADRRITYGRPGDVVLVGDWDGDGKDTFAVRRGNVFYVKNRLTGPPELTLTYGRASDTILVGDWDGDGKDTFAIPRGATYYVRNILKTGPPHFTATYGRPGDAPIVGDWDGDGKDSLGIRRRDAITAPRNGTERIAAAYGMSVRYSPRPERCSPTAAGCYGLDRSYIWISPTRMAGWSTARKEHTAWHEVGHSLQYKACGRMDLPRLEPLANALADALQGTTKPWVTVTPADQRNARTILAGRCPF